MAVAAVVEAVLAAGVLAVCGAGERGTDIALQVTARVAFLLFLPAYAGGALAALGIRLTGLPDGRRLGLAFAAAMAVHLALVAWLCWIGFTPARGVFLLFGTGALFTYLLAAASWPPLQRALGAVAWRWLRRAGMHYIAFAFAADFLGHPVVVSIKFLVFYGPFAIASLAAPALCAAAQLRQARMQAVTATDAVSG